jgi:hypothetical protein
LYKYSLAETAEYGSCAIYVTFSSPFTSCSPSSPFSLCIRTSPNKHQQTRIKHQEYRPSSYWSGRRVSVVACSASHASLGHFQSSLSTNISNNRQPSSSTSANARASLFWIFSFSSESCFTRRRIYADAQSDQIYCTTCRVATGDH